MRFFALRLAGTSSAVQVASAILEQAPGAAPVSLATIEEADGSWTLEALYDGPPDGAVIEAALRQGLGRAPPFDVAPLPDRDWVAASLEGLAPVRAGRFFVHGAHDRGRAPGGAIAIEIEAGRAFGTGHHATTRGCLLALGVLARRARRPRVLDLGTGSGVLAIAVAKLWRAPVVASDIDPLAARIAAANARANGTGPLVTALIAAGTHHWRIAAGAPYDVIVANILTGPLVALAADIAALSAPRGAVVLSGLLEGQAAGVLAAYRARGLVPLRCCLIDGWATLTLAWPAEPGQK